MSYGKSIRGAQLEGDFETLLKQLQPSKELLGLVCDMFMDAWEMRRAQATEFRTSLRREISNLERKIGECLYSIADAGSTTVIKAFERRIEKPEAEKLKVGESSKLSASQGAPQRRF
ncbi:MAG: hypothetical protein AAGD13_21450 [Pseudomonadota bacterium]